MKLFVALLALPLGVGCIKRSPPVPPPAISELRINYKDVGAPGAPVLDLEPLAKTARTTIASTSGLVLHEDGGADSAENPVDTRARRYKMRVQIELEGGRDRKTQKGIMHALIVASLTPLGADPGTLSFEQQALAEKLYAPELVPDWQGTVDRAVRDCVAGLGARVKLADGNGAAIASAIDGSDEDLREEAMRIAAERRAPEAVPALIKRLKGEDPALRDRAIGALGEIGDARAVRPLTEVAKFYDVNDLPKVLDALATIGGPEARSYLEFVSSGHENPEMRELAKQALAHLDRREAERRRDLGAPKTSRR